MTFKKSIYSISIGAAILVISGCGLTSQDEGLGEAKPISGVVVDGYLAGATVFVDVNENNTLDAWEVRALTDTKGYYSYNPIDGVNYCNLPETDAKSVHCLKAPVGYDEVMLRMTGGYDLSTVEPFKGTISIKINLSSVIIDVPTVATPITGLLSEMTDEEKIQFLSDESITDTKAASDFLDYTDSLLSADDRRMLISLALKVHKVADVVAILLDAEFDQGALATPSVPEDGFFGVADGVPVDGSVYVYRAMVEEWRNANGTSISIILSNVTQLQSVVDRARQAIIDGPIARYNARLPTDPDTGEIDAKEVQLIAPATVASAAHAALVVKIAATVDAVFGSSVILDETGANTLSLDINSRMRAIDVVVSLTRNGEAASAVDNAVALASDTTYLANLRAASTDMVSLKKKFVAGMVVASDADYSNRQPFTALFGSNTDNAFSATDTAGNVNTEGFVGNTLALNNTPSGQTSADMVAVNFEGATADATGGNLTIDATLLGGDFAKTDPVTGDAVPLALTGTWEQVDDYTMMMNIEVTTGVFQPVIVKPDETGGYYFDLGGEQISWGAGAQ